MPTRSPSQKTGDAGERLVERVIDDHPDWIARRRTHDFGIDLEAELAPQSQSGQQLKGKLLKVQVKAFGEVTQRSGFVSVQIDRSLINYANGFHIPVILAVVCDSSKSVWWCWLQEWALLNDARLMTTSETLAIRIPLENTLEHGLPYALPAIATGASSNAMILALRNILAQASGWENRQVAQGVIGLLNDIHGPSRDWALEKIIGDLLDLGQNALFWQAQQSLPLLFALIEKAGDTFTAGQVFKMVARGDTYSRTGLNALSFLYDHWHEHAVELALPKLFASRGLPELAWYTAMRERFPYKGIFAYHILEQNEMDLRFEGAFLVLDEDARDYIFRKYPNRGDTVLLDELRYDPPMDKRSNTGR